MAKQTTGRRTLKLTHNINPIGGRGIIYPAAAVDGMYKSTLTNALRIAGELLRDNAAEMRKIPPEGVPMISHQAAQDFAKHFDNEAAIVASLNEWFTTSEVFVAPNEDEPDAKGNVQLVPLRLPKLS